MHEIVADVSGRVQGVMFRDFTRRTARRLGIVGEVSNQQDGTVRVIAQGSEEALTEFAAALKRGPTFARVNDVAITWGEPTATYDEFTITR